MTAQFGKDFLLYINSDLVGGFRSNSFSLNGETIDITNKGSGGFRELLSGGGLKTMSTTASGVFVDQVKMQAVSDLVLSGDHASVEIIIPGYGKYTGSFVITSLDMAGEHNGEVTFNISLSSAGVVAYSTSTTPPTPPA